MNHNLHQGLHKYQYGELPSLPSMPHLEPQFAGHAVKGIGLEGASFGSTINQMLQKANQTIGAPDALTVKAVTTGKVDIHEVMIAMGKADVAFKLITALTQKVTGAFDKLSSMQV